MIRMKLFIPILNFMRVSLLSTKLSFVQKIKNKFFRTCHRTLLMSELNKYFDHISGDVLVLGAGSATNLSFEKSSSIIFTDISPSSNKVIFADAHDLQYSDNSFDSIIAIELFEHLHSPGLAASEISRLLKKGGFAIISTPFAFRIHADPFDYHRLQSLLC